MFNFLWVVLAVVAGIACNVIKEAGNKEYKVEINRLYNNIRNESEWREPEIKQCKYVKEVSFLSLEDMEDADLMHDFYRNENYCDVVIKPLYKENKVEGFIKFNYVAENEEMKLVIIIVEISLIVMEIFILLILFYMKERIIRPFQRVEKLPYELSKGHFKRIVKDEKTDIKTPLKYKAICQSAGRRTLRDGERKETGSGKNRGKDS